MRVFLWKLAAFDPVYVNHTNATTQGFCSLSGMVLLCLASVSLISYAFVGFLIFNNLLVGIAIAMLSTFLLLNFYRIALITFSRYTHSHTEPTKINLTSAITKIFFISLNLIMLIYCFLLLLFHKELLPNIGVLQSIKQLHTSFKSSYFIAFVLYVMAIYPLFARYFLPKYSIDYDFQKNKSETEIIKRFFGEFLKEYKYTLQKVSEGKANGYVYDLMKNPPFDNRILPQELTIESEDVLFDFLTNQPI